jgi:hypothetical protein
MIFNFTSLTPSYSAFAKNFGEPFVMDQTIYDKYFAPSINHLKRYNISNGNTNSYGQKMDVELGLVMHKKNPNAYCAYHEEKHFICIEHLFPVALLEFLHRLMANPGFLPDLGDTSWDRKLVRKKHSSAMPGFEIISGYMPIKSMDEIGEIYGTLCLERIKATMLLYEHAMSFLYAHELCHSLMGHVLFVNQNLGVTSLEENYAKDNNDDFTRICCYLEQHADNGAAWNTIGWPVSGLNDKRTFDNKVSDATFRILGSSLLLYFLAMTDINLSKGDQDSIYKWDDHPSSAARAIGITMTPMTQIPSYNRDFKAIIDQASLTARIELLRLANADALFGPYNWLLKDDISPILENQSQLSPERKREVEAEIKRLAFLI